MGFQFQAKGTCFLDELSVGGVRVLLLQLALLKDGRIQLRLILNEKVEVVVDRMYQV